MIKSIDDLFNDRYYQQIVVGLMHPNSKRYFLPEELEPLVAYKDHTTSKKSEGVRRQELIKVILKPFCTFLEENLQYYMLEINKNHILRCVLQTIIESKIRVLIFSLVGCSEDYMDLIDEMLR